MEEACQKMNCCRCMNHCSACFFGEFDRLVGMGVQGLGAAGVQECVLPLFHGSAGTR